MIRRLARRGALLGALLTSVAACSSGAKSSDAASPITEPVSRLCDGDGSADLAAASCWALGQLATRTGCADGHCQVDGGLLKRTPNYAACGITGVPPDGTMAQGTLGDAPGALAADDDRCEFRTVIVPVCTGNGRSLYFDADLSTMEGGAVPPGAEPYVEAFSGPTHLAPSTGTSTEMSTGHYRIGPVVFDVPGRWTVTIHFYGTCRDDLVNSPHGHVTLTLQVPK